MQPRRFASARLLTSSLLARGLAVSLVSAGLAAAPITANADATTFSGDAYVAKATVNVPVLGPTTVGPIAESQLPSQGGSDENSILTVSLPNAIDNSTLLTAEVGHTAAIGQGDRSHSEASVAAVNLTVASHTVSADSLMARAMAVCGPSVSGSSDLANLVVDGTPITVSGKPNQTISLNPIGSVIIDEQQSSVGANSGSIDVNALHVIVSGIADVVIAHAHADITCNGSPNCSGSDFLTGGGWITAPDGARGTFAVAGGWKNGAWWGHLLYIDHGNGMKVHGTGVTYYGPGNSGPTSREIDGKDDLPDSPGYKIDTADNGEPGHGSDNFYIDLLNGYTAGGLLQGGNIQLHKPCQ